MFCFFFFFQQKTAYEIRISDWSSDVCSSDLLEQLLEDVVPSKDEIYGYLTKDLREDLIVPVFLGAAERGNGVFRLMKALRHETPEPAATLERLGSEARRDPLVQVFKSYHMPHTGKLSDRQSVV